MNESKKKPWFPLMEPEGSPPPTTPERESVRALVAQTIAGLSPRTQLALRLRFVDELDHDQLAAELGVSRAQARVLVHRGVKRFAHALVKRLALQHGAAGCATRLAESIGGAKPASARHSCFRCLPVWDEIAVLRSLPSVLPIGVVRAAMDRLKRIFAVQGPALVASAERGAAMVALTGLTVLPVVASPVTDSSGPPPARSAAPAIARAPVPASVQTTAPVNQPPAVPGRVKSPPLASEQVAGGGGTSVTRDGDATQVEAGQGSPGWSGVVICNPLETCPPDPSP